MNQLLFDDNYLLKILSYLPEKKEYRSISKRYDEVIKKYFLTMTIPIGNFTKWQPENLFHWYQNTALKFRLSLPVKIRGLKKQIPELFKDYKKVKMTKPKKLELLVSKHVQLIYFINNKDKMLENDTVNQYLKNKLAYEFIEKYHQVKEEKNKKINNSLNCIEDDRTIIHLPDLYKEYLITTYLKMISSDDMDNYDENELHQYDLIIKNRFEIRNFYFNISSLKNEIPDLKDYIHYKYIQDWNTTYLMFSTRSKELKEKLKL